MAYSGPTPPASTTSLAADLAWVFRTPKCVCPPFHYVPFRRNKRSECGSLRAIRGFPIDV
jgi:hypothetical protein